MAPAPYSLPKGEGEGARPLESPMWYCWAYCWSEDDYDVDYKDDCDKYDDDHFGDEDGDGGIGDLMKNFMVVMSLYWLWRWWWRWWNWLCYCWSEDDDGSDFDSRDDCDELGDEDGGVGDIDDLVINVDGIDVEYNDDDHDEDSGDGEYRWPAYIGLRWGRSW